MASQKDKDDSSKKRVIEFDMFVRDLEPKQDEKIVGGGTTRNECKPDDSKTDRQ